VEIRWPNGNPERIAGIAADQHEGKGPCRMPGGGGFRAPCCHVASKYRHFGYADCERRVYPRPCLHRNLDFTGSQAATVDIMAKQRPRKGNRSILYVRVSTLEQLKGVSLDAQEERLRACCQMTGLELVSTDVIREEGVSASLPLYKRPGGSRLLERLNSGVTHVVSLKLDRLFRDAEEALRQTKAWDRAGITLHLIDMGGASINTASAMGRMLLTTIAGFAELERNLVAERTTLSLAHKKNHRQVYNHVPFGFDQVGKVLVENPHELAVIRLIEERRDDGWSLHRIAEALNEDHVPTKLGGRWYARTVKNLLDNGLYETAL